MDPMNYPIFPMTTLENNPQQKPKKEINDSAVAYLELILGPMKSGKTSRLIQLYNQYTFCNIPCVVINHRLDRRYHDTLLSSHDEIKIPCVQTERLADVWQKEKEFAAEVFLINEGQFFDDLYEVVLDMLDKGKKVYVGGLDGDFRRNKFGQILDLIPYCDSVTKLKSLCGICRDGTTALFSLRLSEEKEQTVIGVDNYIPVCRKCYHS
jgi:thymidine kinase